MSEASENIKYFDARWISNPPRFLLKRWFSISEAAIYTGFKEITLRKAVYAGELCISQKGDRGKWYFDIFQLDDFMLQNFGPYKGPVDERMRDKRGRFKRNSI